MYIYDTAGLSLKKVVNQGAEAPIPVHTLPHIAITSHDF